MYADTVLDVASEKLSDIEAMLAEDINVLADWLEGNQLVINLKKDKTESMVFGTAKRLSKEENLSLSIAIGTRVINFTRSYKYVGVLLDQSLIFNQQLQNVFRKTSGKLKLFQKIRSSLTIHAAETIYQSMTIPLMTYCDLIYLDLSESSLTKFQHLETRAKNIL